MIPARIQLKTQDSRGKYIAPKPKGTNIAGVIAGAMEAAFNITTDGGSDPAFQSDFEGLKHYFFN